MAIDMQVAHTQGLWLIMPEEHDEWYMSALPIRAHGTESWDWIALVPPEKAADARLISAAPDLLAVIEDWLALDAIDDPNEYVLLEAGIFSRARDAAAKARGETA